MSQVVISHFQKQDPLLSQFVEGLDFSNFPRKVKPDDYFFRLTDDIIGQQLSVKVASVIGKRFVSLFPNEVVTPALVLKQEDQKLRDIGMSWAKVKYAKDLAAKVHTGELDLLAVPNLDNESVISELTKVKGIGRWTAEMFLIFTLGREDVFSYGDLGLRRAIEKQYNFPKDTDVKKFEKLVEKWKPYRSYASLALWRSLDNEPK